MQWHDWDERAFARARGSDRPVLLLLAASWCRWCRELEREVLEDDRVRALIAQRFVPVRVDKDRRPDIDARYTKGGWPTLAYLDDSGELIAADTYLEIEPLLRRLRVVSDYYAEHRDAIRRRLAEEADRRLAEGDANDDVRGAAQVGRELSDWVTQTLLESADPVHGGWGSPQKFPHPDAIDFALVRWSQTGNEALRRLVLRTLRHMERGEIHDVVEGGFYRYATAPDWSAPHFEKMLDSNAQRLVAYLEAYQALGEDSFRRTAEGILQFLGDVLLDEETGAYRGSQDADPTYAHKRSVAARREHGAPACDTTLFANWNAMAVSALLKAGAVLQADEYRGQALRTLDFLLRELFDAREGVYHYWDGNFHLPGLLSDQAYVLRALTDAVQHTGDNRYLDAARTLADLALETLRSETGAFYDTRYDPGARGILRQRNRSLLENAVMAEALLQLSFLLREEPYAQAARAALASFANDYKRYGHYVAGYARAVEQSLQPPVHVTILGNPSSSDTRELLAAAWRPFFASRIVQVINPRTDTWLLERSGLPAGDRPPESAHAYVQQGRESFAETADPSLLPVVITRVERGS